MLRQPPGELARTDNRDMKRPQQRNRNKPLLWHECLIWVSEIHPMIKIRDICGPESGKLFTLFCLLIACVNLLSGCGGKSKQRSAEESQQVSSPMRTGPESQRQASLANTAVLESWTGDLDGMIGRRKIRALVVYSKSAFFYDKGHPRGISYEALRELETVVNKKFKTGKRPVQVTFLPTPIEGLEQALVEGRGDLIAVGIVVTPERQKRVDFTVPVATDVKQIIVTGANGPILGGLDDLAGKEVFANSFSANYQTLTRMNESFTKTGKPPIQLKASDSNLTEEDLLEMANAGLIDVTAANSVRAEFWAKVYDHIRPHSDLVLGNGGELAWAIRKNSPQLKQLLDEYIKTHRLGTEFGNTVLRRYLRDTKWVKDSTTSAEMKKFRAYVGYFKKYAAEYDFDYLLLAAQGYQESMLNQDRRSPRGAIGVMQVLPRTAAAKPINIPDITTAENNIHAGARVLRSIQDTCFKGENVDPLDKTLIAFAAYNAGPTRITRLRKQAANEGLDPNKWFGNVELVVAEDVGQETVRYVGNIYKYYVAYQLALEQSERTQKAKAGMNK
jgi:membrane-bound lytic murein transglycosylase MltF